MTYSLNYGDLLRRQAEIQRLGKMPAPTPAALRIAYLTEVGELAQELKPAWAWWTKPGSAKEVNPERVLSELSDVLHFWLLIAQREDWKLRGGLELNQRARAEQLDTLLGSLYGPVKWWTPRVLCEMAHRYGFTPDDLARAYWEKTEVNLERWRLAAQPD